MSAVTVGQGLGGLALAGLLAAGVGAAVTFAPRLGAPVVATAPGTPPGQLDPATATARVPAPPCAHALGPAWRELAIAPRAAAGADGTRPIVLVAVDTSGSNADQLSDQLDATVALLTSLPPTTRVGALVLDGASAASSAPDMAIEPAIAEVVLPDDPPLPCGDDCRPASLRERGCYEQVREALRAHVRAHQAAASEATRVALAARHARIRRWTTVVREHDPAQGTSVRGLFHKVAQLPAVRRDPAQLTLVVLGDLVEAGTSDRARLLRWAKAAGLDRDGRGAPDRSACPPGDGDEPALAGARIVLLETTRAGAPTGWAARWTHWLRCAGAEVDSSRWTASVPLRDYLGPPADPATSTTHAASAAEPLQVH